MPLGDSITESLHGNASYRYWLWHELMNGGWAVDFVGTQYGVYNGVPSYNDFDQDHEGHWGWRADEVLADVAAWTARAQPHIVLIHLGHNDLWQGQDIASTLQDLRQIILSMRQVEPRLVFFLAQLIPAVPGIGLDSISQFNAEIPGIRDLLHTPESPIMIVDQFTGFDPVADTWDGVHPNASGEQKMSARWFEALDSFFGAVTGLEDEAAPSLVSLHELSSYPNPFNPQSAIRFVMPGAGRARLSIHDTAGRRIATLFDGHAAAGAHQIDWIATAHRRVELAAGLYFARLETDFGVETSKLVLVK
jgi:lysophospholipase L1-like esterase